MRLNLLHIIALAGALLGSMPVLADFNPDNPPEPLVTRRLTVGVTPSNAGRAYGEGNYRVGEEVQLSTDSNAYYVFQYWTLNGVQYSSQRAFSYIMGDSAVTFIAHYKYDKPVIPDKPFDPKDPPEPFVSQLVKVIANPSEGGYTQGSGTYRAGTTVMIGVTPYTQYAFGGWTLNGRPYPEMSTQFSYTVGDSAAYFEARLIEKHLITVKTHPRAAGVSTMTVGGVTMDNEILIPGEQVLLGTTGNPDYRFRHWTLNGKPYNTSASCNYTMGDTTASFVAVYDYIGTGDTTVFNPANPPEPTIHQDVFIKVISATPDKGTVTGTGTYPFASPVTITAIPVNGYVFRYWKDNGSNQTPRTVVATMTDTLYIAFFGNDTCRLDTTICYGETLQVGDTILNQTGHREFYTRRPDGLYTWNIVDLQVWHPMSSALSATICQGDTFHYEGGEYTMAGTYVDTLLNPFGCDSIVTLHLTVNPTYDTTIVASICASERYEDNGFSVNTTGEYVQYLRTTMGCDSIVRLSLTVHEEYESTIMARICRGETYDLNGFNATEAGEYTLELQSRYGCDSIVHLALIVDSVPTVFYYDSICEGTSYAWRDSTYALSGRYWSREQSDTVSCGYILHELNLLVHPQLQVRYSEQSFLLCQSAERPTVRVSVTAGSPAGYSLALVDSATQRQAVWTDLPFTGSITVPELPDTLFPGYYSLIITMQDSFCNDLATTLPLQVNYAADSLITQRWGDLLAVRKTAYDRYGGFTAYRWYRDGLPLDGETASTLYLPDEGLEGSIYQVEVTRTIDGVTLISCPFTPTPQPATVTLVVTPSATTAKAPLRVRTAQDGLLTTYNRDGVATASTPVSAGDNHVCAPAASGIYLLQLTTVSGERYIQKLLVY